MLKKSMAAIMILLLCITFLNACRVPADIGGEATASPPATPTPAPVDLSAELNAISGQANFYYNWGPTLTEKLQEKQKTVDVAPFIKLLLESPVYNESDFPVNDTLTVMLEKDSFKISPTVSGEIVFDYKLKRYVSFSGELYDKLIELTGLKQYDKDNLENVKNITISKNTNGKKSVQITDTSTIQKITGYLAVSRNTPFDFYFQKVDTEMTLHTDDGDIVCRFLSAPDEYQTEEFQINRLYCYESREFLDYVRSLLD